MRIPIEESDGEAMPSALPHTGPARPWRNHGYWRAELSARIIQKDKAWSIMKDVVIVVATHKQSPMPADGMYLPLHVGAAVHTDSEGRPVDFGYTRDDTGDSISEWNGNFGTQTGLYWEWKNLDAEYKGLVHYRRFFVVHKSKKGDIIASVITHDDIQPMLGKYKVFVPQKRWYLIETLYSHYAHTHDENHFRIVRDVIQRDHPDYLAAFDRVMKRRWGYMFNMMILQRKLMDDYCSWLFDILFKVVNRIDTKDLDDYNSRFCGRISEILFDVWLENKIETKAVQKNEIKELPYIEDVDWKYKIKAFLAAKFMKKKYERSS